VGDEAVLRRVERLLGADGGEPERERVERLPRGHAAGLGRRGTPPATGALALWVVRGAEPVAAEVTLRRSEALALAHAPAQCALVVVEVDDDGATGVPVRVHGAEREVPAFDAWAVTVRVG